MLVNCKPGCIGKRVTTDAALDVDQDEVICKACQEIIPVSKFVKTTMKQQRDIIQHSKKSFQFSCLSCKKKVQTKLEGSKPVGIGCESGSCEFNISKFILIAMKNVSASEVEKPETDNLE